MLLVILGNYFERHQVAKGIDRWQADTKRQADTNQQARFNIAEPSEPSCSASQFKVSKLKSMIRRSSVWLTGIVENGCAVAAGVKLKWTVYFADGSVAFSDEFWPASTINIRAKSTYAFETLNEAPREKIRFKVEPINVRVW